MEPPLRGEGASNAGGVGRYHDSEPISKVRAVNAATSQVLSTESLVEHGQRTASCDTSLVVSGGFFAKLQEKTTKVFMTRSLNVTPKATEQRI